MTEPLPCPFCGHVGLSHSEGSTFRWLNTECNGCGAQCGEQRINTMSMERSAAIEQAKEAAIVTWNTRAAQPKQEPVASIYISQSGEREFDDWKCKLPIGRNILYPAPQQRPWLGLTDDEAKEIYSCIHGYDSDKRIARAIEVRLKEKNHD